MVNVLYILVCPLGGVSEPLCQQLKGGRGERRDCGGGGASGGGGAAAVVETKCTRRYEELFCFRTALWWFSGGTTPQPANWLMTQSTVTTTSAHMTHTTNSQNALFNQDRKLIAGRYYYGFTGLLLPSFVFNVLILASRKLQLLTFQS